MTPTKGVKIQSPNLIKSSWQSNHGTFSVSKSNLDSVTAYIRDQREHHRTKSFREEFRDFLTRNKLIFDEDHVWD